MITYTRTDLERAVSRAVASERVRIAQVFNNHASRGRERTCATLLSAVAGYSADEIAAELPQLPTDRQAEAVRIREVSKRA